MILVTYSLLSTRPRCRTLRHRHQPDPAHEQLPNPLDLQPERLGDLVTNRDRLPARALDEDEGVVLGREHADGRVPRVRPVVAGEEVAERGDDVDVGACGLFHDLSLMNALHLCTIASCSAR